MVDRSAVDTIRDWFRRTPGPGFRLPDRWFGDRPFDGFFTLSWVEVRPHKLLLELDEQLLLTFTEIDIVKVHGGNLVLTDFKQLIVDGQGYGDMMPYSMVYRSGTVEFVKWQT